MRAVRITVVAALTFGALAVPRIGTATDASQAHLPEALSKPSAIAKVYPDLYQREAARKTGRSWERLRRQARTRWMGTHPCADATLARRYALGASSWSIVEATWACDRVPASTRSFLRCIADKEGGREYPDVWYTEPAARAAMGGRNYRGWLGGRFAGTDRVVGHVQVRPYHARRVAPALSGHDLRVTADTFRVITHPVNHARIAVSVGASAYATQGRCS